VAAGEGGGMTSRKRRYTDTQLLDRLEQLLGGPKARRSIALGFNAADEELDLHVGDVDWFQRWLASGQTARQTLAQSMGKRIPRTRNKP
jgi:hypothetical protein